MPMASQEVRNAFPFSRIFLLEGDLGAGKTSFVKAFCEVLGIEEAVSSPTFNIVHAYEEGDITVYHFDLYRLKNTAELEEIGFDEYLPHRQAGLRGDAYVFIEWPELAMPFLEGEEYVILRFSYAEGEGRNISAQLCEKS
jgi:tRNA threonylcarbamoyladenosine biosynthesis protein TsaE